MRSSLLAVIAVTVASLTFSYCTEIEKPTYIKIFSQHRQWEGHYMYDDQQQYCLFFIHSEHYTKKDGLLATLKDKSGATIEMEGESPGTDDLQVEFSVHLVFNNASRFPSNFSFTGTLYEDQGLWNYKGIFTVPSNGSFSEIFLTQSDNHLGPVVDEEDLSWRYAVIIGVPIVLAIVGIAGTVALVYWALKKGYIRHVPKTYDNFKNPAVKYETDKESVHI